MTITLDLSGPDTADRALGDVQRVSNQALRPFSAAAHCGAENLLVKACRAIEARDQARAETFVARAVGLPFDEHEQVDPAATAAQGLLFELVTDTMDCCDEDDPTWLDVALDLLVSADHRGARFVLRNVLAAIDQDYDLDNSERRRLRAAIADLPSRPDAWELRLPTKQLREEVLAVVRVCTAYQRAVEREWSQTVASDRV